MTSTPLPRPSTHHLGILSLAIWSAFTLFLLRQDALGIDEGAAKSLLLLWSISDQVASSVVTLGTPDLRIFLYAPVGFLWTGKVFAAKVLTTASMALAAWLLYSWQHRKGGAESALLATGLLLIAPATLTLIDSLAPGAYLLPAFAMGAWLDNAYRTTPRPFGGWYFAQLFLSAFCVSLHPVGLAYPIALLWGWRQTPLDQNQQKHFYAGVGFVVMATLLIKMGWHDQPWMQNPIPVLANMALGTEPGATTTIPRWITGSIMLLALVLVILKQYRLLLSDMTGRSLALGLMLGIATCDEAWAMLALALLLYYGSPLLLRSQPTPSGGLLQQRGVALAATIILSILFMRSDRAHYEMRESDIISGQDRLIRTLASEVESARKIADEAGDSVPIPRFRVASQWPGRTMIACKCDTLPLPPATKDAESQLAMLHSITHLMLDPRAPQNIILARNLASLGGETAETVALEPEGVLLHFRPNAAEMTK